MVLSLQAIISDLLLKESHLDDYFDSLPEELRFVIGERMEPLQGLSDDQRRFPFAIGKYTTPTYLPRTDRVDRWSYPALSLDRRTLIDNNGCQAPDVWLKDFFVRGIIAGLIEKTPLLYNPFDRGLWRFYDISASSEILHATGHITPDEYFKASSIFHRHRTELSNNAIQENVTAIVFAQRSLGEALYAKLQQGIEQHRRVIRREFASNTELLSTIITCLGANKTLLRLGIFWSRNVSALELGDWTSESSDENEHVYLLDEAVEISQSLVYHHVRWAIQKVYDALAAEDLSDIRATLEHQEPVFYGIREIARFVEEISDPIYSRPFSLVPPIVDNETERFRRLKQFFEGKRLKFQP